MSVIFNDIEINIDIDTDNSLNNDEMIHLLNTKDTDNLGEAPKLLEQEKMHQITLFEYMEQLEEEKRLKEEEARKAKQQAVVCNQHYTEFMAASFNRDLKLAEEEKKRLEEDRVILSKMNLDHPYIGKDIVTNAELQLFNFMYNNIIFKEAVHILVKPRLADFLDINEVYKRNVTPKEYDTRLYKILAKHIDYLICRADNLKIICAFELDDFTHDTTERKEKDAFKINALHAAGIKLLRYVRPIKDIRASDLIELNTLIGNEFAPKCPRCGNNMVTKQRASDKKFFFACFDNMDCRYTQEINSKEEN